MTPVLVDSDILIEVSRGADSAIVARWMELSHSDNAVLYSPISVAELWAGARPKEYEALRRLFLALTCAPIDAAVGHQAGAYLRQYRRSHAVERMRSSPRAPSQTAPRCGLETASTTP